MGIFEFAKSIGSSIYREFEKRAFPNERLRYKEIERDELFDDENVTNKEYSKHRLGELQDYLKLYRTHPHVYACARDVADAMSAVDFQLQQDGKEVKKSDVLNVLKRPNEFQTWRQFIKLSALFLELSGNCFWELVRDKQDNSLIGMYVLAPHKMSIIPHPKKKVAGYIYRPMPGKDIPMARDEVMHLSYPDPNDDWWGIGSFTAAQIGITLDFYALAWNKNFFKEGAEPGGVLETDNSLSSVAYKRLFDSWKKKHGSYKNSHVMAILEEGLKYRPVTWKHTEMEWSQLRSMTKEEIYNTAGVPIDWRKDPAQKKSFYYDNIIPKLTMLSEYINALISDPEVNGEDVDNFEIKFLTRSIESMVEDEMTKAQIAQSNISHGVWTANEARERLYGLGKVDWGDDYWAPVGLMPTKNHPGFTGNGDNAPGAAVTNGFKAGTSSPTQVPKLQNESRLDQVKKDGSIPIEKIELDDPDWDSPAEVWFWKAYTEWQKAAGSDEKKLKNTIEDYLEKAFYRIKETLRPMWKKPKKKKLKKADGTEEDSEEFEDLKDYIVFVDWEKEEAILRSVLKKEGAKIIKKHGNLTFAKLNIPLSFNIDDPSIQEWMENHTAARVRNITETTREMLRRHLTEAQKKGEDFEQAMERIGDIFLPDGGIAQGRAQKIARTELITMSNNAKLHAAKQTGVVKRKTWVSQRLPTTRQEPQGADHIAMHGTTVDLDEKFVVKSRSGNDLMDAPGDNTASGENVCNCLCILEFPPETEEFKDLFDEAVASRKVKKGSKKAEDDDMQVNVTINMPQNAQIEKKEKPQEVHIHVPEVKIPQPQITLNVEKQAPPVVNVPAPIVFVEQPNIEVKAPEVKVNVEKQDQPQIVVNVPQQPAPIVNVTTPEVKVDVNPEVKVDVKMPEVEEKVRVIRDEKGRITGTVKEIKEKE